MSIERINPEPTGDLRLNSSMIGEAFSTASTLVGVVQLGYTGQLVELDVTAALP